ncbi:Dapper 2 [Saguinus oedipus]|uniref:Dapper 2 n=1 Tax=Saguinus oedipus TaxID=9490 RepID=A0ABQ9VZC6_SAGOE|nr:Dapper 2 [Saguinus oedipus]
MNSGARKWLQNERAPRQSRLRQQDIGLKTHLDQLDLQISKLQLDLGTTSGEALDSDSRPSSGTRAP